MALKFVHKIIKKGPNVKFNNSTKEKSIEKIEEGNKNKKIKKNNDMTTKDAVEAIANAEAIASKMKNSVKVVKKDYGEIIERAESSKIVLTEDNRQVLND